MGLPAPLGGERLAAPDEGFRLHMGDGRDGPARAEMLSTSPAWKTAPRRK
jgi:hypothetical protein